MNIRSNINRATESSQERLRGIKEDMINLNVKVDNVTEKLIMDRLGLIENGIGTNGSDPAPAQKKTMNKIEEDIDKIKFYTQRNYRILGITSANENLERKARNRYRERTRSRSPQPPPSGDYTNMRRSSSRSSSNRANGGRYSERIPSYRNGKQSR